MGEFFKNLEREFERVELSVGCCFCCLLLYVNTMENQNYLGVTANPGFRGQLAIFQF